MLILKGFFCQINGCFSRGDGPLELPTLPFSFHPVICGKNHKQRHWVVKFYFREYSMHCQSPATPISQAKAVIQAGLHRPMVEEFAGGQAQRETDQF